MGHAKHWIATAVWVGLLFAGTSGVSSCTPGELDEDQEKFLRKEIKKHYPAQAVEEDASLNESDVNPDASDDTNVDSEEDESSVQTSEAETSASSTTRESSDTTTVGADAGAGAGAGGEVPDCFLQMVSTTCSGSACHYGGAFNFQPNFESENLFEMLTTTGSPCSTRTSDFYIDLENPQDSYLPQRVFGEGCGSPMPPPDVGEISAAERECLEGWLEAL
jgi:hypothetical protein